MNKTKLSFGIVGTLGALAFAAAAVIGIVTFESGAFSPLNGFVGELGAYTTGYMSASPALNFNILIAAAGLLLAVFMVGYGIVRNTALFTATAFFGILTGILAVAQAVFTLNYTGYHYITTTAFFASAFIFGILMVIALIFTDRTNPVSIIAAAVALVSAGLSAAFVWFMATGGMTQVFVEDASQVGRLSLMPFALIEWLAVILLFVLLAVLAVRMLTQTSQKSAAKPKAGKPARNESF